MPTLRDCFEELAQRAVQESSSYQQYLLELVERECQARSTKRTERMLRDSRLPLEKDLASFDMARLPAKVSRQVRTLVEGSFVDRRENLLLFGKSVYNASAERCFRFGGVRCSGGGGRITTTLLTQYPVTILAGKPPSCLYYAGRYTAVHFFTKPPALFATF